MSNQVNSMNKGLTVKDLVTTGIFTALLFVFVLVGGVFFATNTQIEQHRALEQDAAQIKTDRALTGALIERLIDRIEVSHDKQITVRYRFQSEFETYAEVLEQCRNM